LEADCFNLLNYEKADALAKQAFTSHFTGPEPSVGISVTNIYSSINERTVHEQNRMWQELSGCRQAKYFLHRFDSSRAQYDFPGRIYGF